MQLPKTKPLAIEVLLLAESSNKQLGHENNGYLSRAHGFMPIDEPLKNLLPFFCTWDEICDQTPELIMKMEYRKRLDDMPVLIPNPQNLPDEYLGRASMLLGFFAHAYVNCAGTLLTQDDLPDSIMIPWSIISSRLNKPQPFLSYFDLIAYNWQYKSDNSNRTLENMDLLFPIFNCREEQNLYLIQTEMMSKAAPLVWATAKAQEAVLMEDNVTLLSSLESIVECIKIITNESFAKLGYLKSRKHHMDSIVFSKTMMSFAVPIKEDMPGPSGTAFPYAHLIDVFIGRKNYSEGISHEALKIRNLYPPNVKKFLEAIGKVSVANYIAQTNSSELKNAYSQLIASYSGEEGFLNIHRKRVYNFIQTSFKVGRAQTIGGFSADNDEEWNVVNGALANMRGERPQCPFASRKKPKREIKSKKTGRVYERQISLSSLAEHSEESTGYWVELDNEILDITKFIKAHQGGEEVLLEFAGSSITKEFARIHTGDFSATKIANKLVVGELVEPQFRDERIGRLWFLQKQLLHDIVELNNLYQLELSVANKICFGENVPQEDLPFKDFLNEQSQLRLSTVYKERIEKSAAKLQEWMESFDSQSINQCPFVEMANKPQGLNSQSSLVDSVESKNKLSLAELKADAIQLTKILERIPSDVIAVPMEVNELIKSLLMSIKGFGHVQ